MSFGSAYSAARANKLNREEFERRKSIQNMDADKQGYTYNPETNSYSPKESTLKKQELDASKVEAQLDELKAYKAATQAKYNADGIATIGSNIMEGNWDDALKTWNTTPGLKESLQQTNLNVKDISPINFDHPEDVKLLKDFGMEESAFNDNEFKQGINKSIVKVIGQDGKPRLVPIDDIMKQTNSYAMMTKQQRERAQAMSQETYRILRERSMKEQKVIDQKTDLTSKYLENTDKAYDTGIQAKVNKEFYLQHPEVASELDKTLISSKGRSNRRDTLEQLRTVISSAKYGTTYDKLNTGQKQDVDKLGSQKMTEGVSSVKEDSDINEVSNNVNYASKPDAFIDDKGKFDINKATKSEQATLANLDPVKKKSVQEAIIKMENNYKNEQALNKIIEATDTIKDKDAIENVKTYAGKIFGADSEDFLKKVDLDTKSGIFLVNFVKDMSGLSYTDAQLDTFKQLLGNTNLNDINAIKGTLKSFKEALDTEQKALGDIHKGYIPATVYKTTEHKQKDPTKISSGTIVDGYEYLGGPIGDPKSWKKAE